MYPFFQNFVDQGFALVYIDDIFLLALTKTHMLDLNEQLNQYYSSNNLKIAPERSFSILLSVNLFWTWKWH